MAERVVVLLWGGVQGIFKGKRNTVKKTLNRVRGRGSFHVYN